MRVSGLEAMAGGDCWRLTGSTSQHQDNHYGTADTNTKIAAIANDYYKETSIAIGVNDMRLIWGGLFDIKNDWSMPHNLHRLGKSFDVDHLGVDEVKLDSIAAKQGCQRLEVSLIHYERP